jgi:hypothetical protein
MRKLLACAVLVLLVTAPLWAVGTVTTTHTQIGPAGFNNVTRYTSAWTSTAGGAVSGNAITVRRGFLLQAEFRPGTGGTQPSDQYDLTLVTASGFDVLAGAGGNLSNSTAKIVTLTAPVYLDGEMTLDIVIAAAGASKTGTVVLWVGPAR